eukprot:TRINITY_DN10815_c0_g1_i1.p1 TRINITY_DN10815_c0_g1~~TRINITY_DN10815_c0_g1_i1.p1  ORF type:complete len:627 (+),score=133.53 TRINITY_DN10815_c0_g1_i1:129-1883(+)
MASPVGPESPLSVSSPGRQRYGYRLSERVQWKRSDADIPQGTVGKVIGFVDGKVAVEFPGGRWRFPPQQIKPVSAAPSPATEAELRPGTRVKFTRDVVSANKHNPVTVPEGSEGRVECVDAEGDVCVRLPCFYQQLHWIRRKHTSGMQPRDAPQSPHSPRTAPAALPSRRTTDAASALLLKTNVLLLRRAWTVLWAMRSRATSLRWGADQAEALCARNANLLRRGTWRTLCDLAARARSRRRLMEYAACMMRRSGASLRLRTWLRLRAHAALATAASAREFHTPAETPLSGASPPLRPRATPSHVAAALLVGSDRCSRSRYFLRWMSWLVVRKKMSVLAALEAAQSRPDLPPPAGDVEPRISSRVDAVALGLSASRADQMLRLRAFNALRRFATKASFADVVPTVLEVSQVEDWPLLNGTYRRVEGGFRGMPLWRRMEGDGWLGDNGRGHWVVSARRTHFDRGQGWLVSCDKHNGQSPHRLFRWMCAVRGQREWRCSPGVLVVCAQATGPLLNASSSHSSMSPARGSVAQCADSGGSQREVEDALRRSRKSENAKLALLVDRGRAILSDADSDTPTARHLSTIG